MASLDASAADALDKMAEAEKTAEAADEAVAEMADAEDTAEPKVKQDTVPHAFVHRGYMCKRR